MILSTLSGWGRPYQAVAADCPDQMQMIERMMLNPMIRVPHQMVTALYDLLHYLLVLISDVNVHSVPVR